MLISLRLISRRPELYSSRAQSPLRKRAARRRSPSPPAPRSRWPHQGNVRFTAVGAVERMRLEVFDASGMPVFDTGFKPGNERLGTARQSGATATRLHLPLHSDS